MKSFVCLILTCSVLLAQLPKAEAIVLWNGQDLQGWLVKAVATGGSRWVVGGPRLSASKVEQETVVPQGALVNVVQKRTEGWDLYTKQEFGACLVELDVMVAQGASSGVYLMGESGVQVFDSCGRLKLGETDMGAVYGVAAPPVNASRRPGEWQHLLVEFYPAGFDQGGEKIHPARFARVVLNGNLLHRELILPGPTRSGLTGKERAIGPLLLQGDHGPVAFRNIYLTSL
jgi:Domain of Unknown Function (DUF1080)